jgi:transposase
LFRGQAPDRRLAARVQYARLRLDELKRFLQGSLKRISGKSPLAGAIRYALTRWNAPLRYLADGRLEMSNNAAERSMRMPVLGRKNYLFCGSDAGGQRAACVYTIVESAKMSGINPHAYLTDVLRRIRIIPSTRSTPCFPGCGHSSPSQG